MQFEAAIKASREEYVQQLSSLAQVRGFDDEAVNQELRLEKKRTVLWEMFPGVSESLISDIFESNGYVHLIQVLMIF